MRLREIVVLIIIGAIGLILSPILANAEPRYQISAPQTHKNLSVYFIHGQSAKGPVPLTLAEALAKKSVEVIETGDVRQLAIKNVGDQAVFVQMGDIVKGGRQDRVLTRSLLVPPHSGNVPIGSYCVEKGRWARRGEEDVRVFSSASRLIPSKEAKLVIAAMPSKDINSMPESTPRVGATEVQTQQTLGRTRASPQQDIWNKVAKTQDKLTAVLGANIASPDSSTSLQLALENEKLNHEISDYIRALENKVPDNGDVLGFVFSLNGEVNSGDIYPSNGLFKKMWPKLLRAAVTEAIGEKNLNGSPPPAVAAVEQFLRDAREGKAEEEAVPNKHRVVRRKSDNAFFSATVGASDELLHLNLLAR